METERESVLPDILVPTDWLAAHLTDSRLRVLDIRGYVKTTDLGEGRQSAAYVAARDEYDAQHIPGAAFVDWTTDITDPDDPVKVQIAPPDRFARAMEERGVGDDRDVVIVDHSGGHFATRLWWALRFYGHDRAAVLDGGFKKWTAEGRPLTTEVPTFPPARFTPRLRPALRVNASDVRSALDDVTTTIIDARDAGQYRGEVARGPRGGHIPGAINLAPKRLVNEDGTWKPLEEQRRILAAGRVRPDQRVVAYCNGGVTATAVLFALQRLGHRDYANYDGSWNEWGARSELPVEQGDGKG